MNNKGLIITLIVILSVFTVCLIGVFMLLLGNKFHFPKFNIGYGTSNELILDETYEQAFENIDISSSMGDIYIKNSNDNTTRVEIYGDKEGLTKDITDTTLKVSYKDKGCFGICFSKETSKIIIYLPKEYSNKINIKNDYGRIEVEDFRNADVTIEEDCGDVKVDKAKNLNVKNDYGDIEINEAVSANIDQDCGEIEIGKVADLVSKNSYGDTKIDYITNSAKIKADCGSIKIENLNITKNSTIENNLGDVKIKNTNEIYIDSHVSLGDNKVNNNSRKSDITLKIENDCGDVKVNY